MILRGISRSESVIGDQVMAELSCFLWNGGNCSAHDMVTLLSDSWLSDFHINFTLQKISHHYCDHYGAESSSFHAPLPVHDIGSIVSAYTGNQKYGHAAAKGKYLLEVENKIILGKINSIGGVLHLVNHWTSLVITFKQPRIFYGDSLGNSMPPNKALAFRRWIAHMLGRSGSTIQETQIPISPLEIAVQQDPNSCGHFALNAISYYHLQQNSPLLQSNTQSLKNYWMKIALELLQADAVSTLSCIIHCTRTNDANTTIPFTFLNISPPTFFQPLPGKPLMLQTTSNLLPNTPEYSNNHFSVDSPSYPLAEDPSNYPPTEDPPDHLLVEDPTDYPMAENSLGHLDCSILNPNLVEDIPMDSSDDPSSYESPANQPPSSAELSSAAVSDSDFPYPTPLKVEKKANLLNFFSKIPPKEAHERWQK